MRVLVRALPVRAEGHRIDEGGVLDVVPQGDGAAGGADGDLTRSVPASRASTTVSPRWSMT